MRIAFLGWELRTKECTSELRKTAERNLVCLVALSGPPSSPRCVPCATPVVIRTQADLNNAMCFQQHTAWPTACHSIRRSMGEQVMQMAITFMAVVAGLVFSVAVALVVEEFIFGQVFRVFFSPLPVRIKAEQRR